MLFSTEMAYSRSIDHQEVNASKINTDRKKDISALFDEVDNWEYYNLGRRYNGVIKDLPEIVAEKGLAKEVIIYPSEPAEFPGGKKALRRWIDKNIRYPEELGNKIVGDTIRCTVLVESDGSISEIHLGEVHEPAFAKEIFRLVRNMPKFTPAKDAGKIFAYNYEFNIKFRPITTSNSKKTIVAPQEKSDYEEKKKPDNEIRTGEYSYDRYWNHPKETEEPDEDEIFNNVDPGSTAAYPGGVNALMKYIKETLKYPEAALEKKIQGRVIVKFVVEKDGSISHSYIARGVDKALDEEALRIIRNMPNWIPAKKNGQVVRSYFFLPITFKLPED